MSAGAAATELKAKLLAVCKRHLIAGTCSATVREPYVPFLPPSWNGTLVLAEAQNHAGGEYLRWLEGLAAKERIERLFLHREGVGVQPWDDGSLKLALAAACGHDVERTAVSNGVLWSQVQRGRNQNPDGILAERSALVWREMLPILNPTAIVTAGKIAGEVVAATGFRGRHIRWRLPSPTAMSRISSMFAADDLLARFPEVAGVVKRFPEWVAKHRRNKIVFACHAVSSTREQANGKREVASEDRPD